MAPNRVLAPAAACLNGVAAGTIDSRKGRAIVTPAPCKNVRRDRCFFVMNAIWAPYGDTLRKSQNSKVSFSLSLSFETHRSERLRVRAKKTCNRFLPPAARFCEWQANRNIALCDREHMSSASALQS